jgi:CheY-like chemotaxis protein
MDSIFIRDGMKKILVIDDEIEIRDMLEEYLSINNIMVKTASNGKEALEMIDNFKPDAAVADIKMDVMDGIEFSKKVLSDKPDFPIVMITGFYQKYDTDEILSLGVKEIMEKPLHLENLLVTLQKYLH